MGKPRCLHAGRILYAALLGIEESTSLVSLQRRESEHIEQHLRLAGGNRSAATCSLRHQL